MAGRYELRRPRAPGGGFTLLELMIVIAIIAIIAAIAIPNLLAARLNANETAAITVLRNVATAQAQFQQTGRADEDGDAIGEFGTSGELTGQVPIRGTAFYGAQLSRSLANIDPFGEASKNGYVYRMYLPAPAAVATRENAGGGVAAGVLDPNLCEITWFCYAMPNRFGSSGNRTFFLSSHGTMLALQLPAYAGRNCAALHGGAALTGTSVDDLSTMPAVGATGADGNVWLQVQ